MRTDDEQLIRANRMALNQTEVQGADESRIYGGEIQSSAEGGHQYQIGNWSDDGAQQ